METNEQERRIIEMIEYCRGQYEEAIQPLLRELAVLRALRAPDPFIVTRDQWERVRGEG